MPKTIVLKPAPGRRVLNHQRNFRPLSPEGETVEADAQWLRRLADGDVVQIDVETDIN